MNEVSYTWYPYRKTLVVSFLFAFLFHAALFAFVRHFPSLGKLKVSPPERIRVHLRQNTIARNITYDIHKAKPTCFFPEVPPVKRKKVLPKVKKVVKPVSHKTIPKKAERPAPKRPMNTISEQPDLKEAWINQVVNTAAPGVYFPRVASPPTRQETGMKGPSTPQKREVAYPDYGKNPGLVYPPLALRRGFEGRVVLRVLVSKEGLALKVALAKSSGHAILDIAAIKAVREWVFKPGKLNGVPVDMWVKVPVVYKLK